MNSAMSSRLRGMGGFRGGATLFQRLIDLIEDSVGFSFLRQRPGFRVRGARDPEVFGDPVHQCEHLGIFLFGQEIDLEIQVHPTLGHGRLPVFRHENERRKKNGLQRNDQRQEGVSSSQFRFEEPREERLSVRSSSRSS